MRSETPKDRAHPSVPNGATDAHDDRERGDSMAMDLLDTPGGDGSSDGLGFDNGADGGTMLLPHERKLPIAEQRRIIAARKHHDDGIDEDDSLAMGGRRGRGRRRPQADAAQERGHRHGHHGPGTPRADRGHPADDEGRARRDGDAETGKASGGGSARGPVEKNDDAASGSSSGTGSGGGSRVERETEVSLEATQADRKPPATTSRDAVRLDDPAHPHAPLYGAALRAVSELAPAQAAIGPAEQANVAAALTARIAGDPAFAQQVGDPSKLSFGLAQNGERLFAINHPMPEAPNAVHVSVDLAQARDLSIEASSHQVDLAAANPALVQAQAVETHAIEAHAREHAPRQA